MGAYLFYQPRFRPVDVNGDIMPGAKLIFYETGTTTPANTYSDSALTTPNSNPVVADASGEFAPIYLDPSVTYRAILTDADDVQEWDTDPLAPPRDFPAGTVLWFHGTAVARDAAYPPAQWQVLDGNNGTPNGEGRFPIIADGTTYDSGDTGGSGAAQSTSTAGAHDHGAATGSHTLTEDEIPSHRHIGGPSNRLNTFTGSPSAVVHSQPSWVLAVAEGGNQQVNRYYTTFTGGGQGHTHTVASDGAHSHTVTVTPPYVALWALMRRS